jgi:hypothetical protein
MSVRFQNPAEMRLAQNDDVVQTITPDRSDQPFGKAVLPGRGWDRLCGTGFSLFGCTIRSTFARAGGEALTQSVSSGQVISGSKTLDRGERRIQHLSRGF